MPSNLCLDSDSMPNDFHFLEETDLNFDPQYDFSSPNLPSFDILGSSRNSLGYSCFSFLPYLSQKTSTD